MWENKKIAVIGVGGVGGYFGGSLANNGLNVTFIARSSSFRILKEKGLKVESVNGNFTIKPINVLNNPSESGPVDLILVCVKSYQIEETINSIKPLMGEKTVIMPLQNGVDAPNQLANAFGKEHVVGGVCRIMTSQISPGVIKHLGASVIEFGEMSGPISERVQDITKMFEYAGIKSIPYDDFRVAQWSKMMFACPISGLNALTRSTIGELRSVPETRDLLLEAIKEIHRIAIKLGINLKDNLPEITLEGIDRLSPNFTTSLALDISNGRCSELDYQVGAVSRIGKELGVETPINTFIYHCLLPLEERARK